MYDNFLLFHKNSKKQEKETDTNLFAQTNQDSTIAYTWENSKMFNLTSKHNTFSKTQSAS